MKKILLLVGIATAASLTGCSTTQTADSDSAVKSTVQNTQVNAAVQNVNTVVQEEAAAPVEPVNEYIQNEQAALEEEAAVELRQVNENQEFAQEEGETIQYGGNSDMFITLNSVDDKTTVDVTIGTLYSTYDEELSLDTEESATASLGGDGGIGWSLELLSIEENSASFIVHVTEGEE